MALPLDAESHHPGSLLWREDLSLNAQPICQLGWRRGFVKAHHEDPLIELESGSYLQLDPGWAVS